MITVRLLDARTAGHEMRKQRQGAHVGDPWAEYLYASSEVIPGPKA